MTLTNARKVNAAIKEATSLGRNLYLLSNDGTGLWWRVIGASKTRVLTIAGFYKQFNEFSVFDIR